MTAPNRMKFGVFMAPFHRVGENPTLALERDLELLQWLDTLGFDEAYIGEHHSAGWETIASPELFMATAAERTRHIRLGTGVTSLPYHHPFMVANRMVQLDHLTGMRPWRSRFRRLDAGNKTRETAGDDGRVVGRHHAADVRP